MLKIIRRKRFEDVNNELTKTQLFNQRCFAILNPVMNIVMQFLTLEFTLLELI